VIVPLIHILLGLLNDALSHFWDWFEESDKPLTTEEIQARNMALLAEIAVEEKEEEFKGRKEVLSTIVLEQMAIRGKEAASESQSKHPSRTIRSKKKTR
jgi:hypothetical protein